jgi:hypothetical protein
MRTLTSDSGQPYPRNQRYRPSAARRNLASSSKSCPVATGALAAARLEGTIVAVGGGRAGFDPLTILVKKLSVQGCFTYVDELTEVISPLTERAPSR